MLMDCAGRGTLLRSINFTDRLIDLHRGRELTLFIPDPVLLVSSRGPQNVLKRLVNRSIRFWLEYPLDPPSRVLGPSLVSEGFFSLRSLLTLMQGHGG